MHGRRDVLGRRSRPVHRPGRRPRQRARARRCRCSTTAAATCASSARRRPRSRASRSARIGPWPIARTVARRRPAGHGPLHRPRPRPARVTGAVVVVDVLRAFTTAAYAFAAGARHVYLVGTVAEALAIKAAEPAARSRWARSTATGPTASTLPTRRPQVAAGADLRDRVMVQRTSPGTQGVDRRGSAATRLWCARLVDGVGHGGGGPRGRAGRPDLRHDRLVPSDAPGIGLGRPATAELIERARLGQPLEARRTAELVATSEEAARTLVHRRRRTSTRRHRARRRGSTPSTSRWRSIRSANGLRLDRVAPAVASGRCRRSSPTASTSATTCSVPGRRWSCSMARPRPAPRRSTGQVPALSTAVPRLSARCARPRPDALGRGGRVPRGVAGRRRRWRSSTRSASRRSTSSATRWAR